MSANQRTNPLHGGGNSPAFSSDDALRAAGLGIVLSPADVLATKQAAADRTMKPTEIMLATLRNEVEMRQRASRRAAFLARQVERWKRLAFLSVPVLALETALILWMVTR
jgi:hypothetical protein